TMTRRQFLETTGSAATALAAAGCDTLDRAAEPIIDIHQHLNYSGRPDDVLLAHQNAMGVTTTILLPAGTPMIMKSTHEGVGNGLQAQCLGNAACRDFAKAHSRPYRFAANEVPDIPGAVEEIERYLKLGALAIAEQKFGVECDSAEMQRIYELAQTYD